MDGIGINDDNDTTPTVVHRLSILSIDQKHCYYVRVLFRYIGIEIIRYSFLLLWILVMRD